MGRLRRRIDRSVFRNETYKRRLEENPDDQNALDMLDYYMTAEQLKIESEEKPEWAVDNLEHDLRTCDWIAEKCVDDRYAQNLYAALCNNQFVKNDVWPLLKDQRWSCSWRYAGGIIADIRESGDYIDWYCSGIRNIDHDEEVNKQWDSRHYVAESVVTDEIRQDLFTLGWIVVDDPYGEDSA